MSKQIQKLEAIVGYPLLTRTSRVVRLTSAVAAFLERARRTLRAVQEDSEQARSLGRGEAGTLRVGFIGSGMLTPLTAMLGEYRRRFPRVHVQLSESHSHLCSPRCGRQRWTSVFCATRTPRMASCWNRWTPDNGCVAETAQNTPPAPRTYTKLDKSPHGRVTCLPPATGNTRANAAPVASLPASSRRTSAPHH